MHLRRVERVEGWKICLALLGYRLNIVKMKEIVTENPRLNMRDIAAEISTYYESVRTLSNDCLGYSPVVA